VSQRTPKNIPASVHARLLNEAKARGESFDQMLQYFAIERFLYRLSGTTTTCGSFRRFRHTTGLSSPPQSGQRSSNVVRHCPQGRRPA
jgi:hypothetical protein